MRVEAEMRSLVMTAMLLAAPAIAAAQAIPSVVPPIVKVAEAGVIQELQMQDGTRLIGRVESIGEGQFTFRTTSGLELTLSKDFVLLLRPFTGRIVDGELWEDDPNTTRLFFGPTGRSLKRGEAYFGVYEVFMPFVQVGITDRLSIGGGTPLIFGEGFSNRPAWLTPKFQVFDNGRLSTAIGAIHFFNFDGDGANAGIAYGVATYGGGDSAFTIGAGAAYNEETRWVYEPTGRSYTVDEGTNTAPVLMIGGERRASKRVKLVSENYVFKSGGIASVGVRFFGEKLSADFGLVIPLQSEFFIALPMINIVKKF